MPLHSLQVAANGRAGIIRNSKQREGRTQEVATTVKTTVKRTDRVSASFIRELMRRAAQFHLERNGTGALTEADVEAALQELLFAGGSLNCALLGMQRDDKP